MRMRSIRLLIILALVMLPGSCAHDTEWLSRAEYDILATDTDEDFFLIAGNHASVFTTNDPEKDIVIRVITTDELGNPVTLGPFTVTAAITLLDGTRISIEGDVPEDDLTGAVLMHVSDVSQEPEPQEIIIEFSTRGAFTPDIWYFLAFNFSQAAGTSVPTSGQPLPFISDEQRGENWEMYVMIHQDESGSTELSSLRTTRLPSVWATGRGPADATSGLFNPDGLVDVAIACELAGTIQVLPAYEPNIYEPLEIKYWEKAYDIPAAAGVAPLRIHSADLTGDDIADLLVLYAGEGSGNGFLRILAGDDANADGNHDGTFTQQGSDISLEITPVDWLPHDFIADEILDFNSDTFPDLVVLGTTDTAGQLLVFSGVDGGGYSAPVPYDTAADPVSLAGGDLVDSSFDLAVGSNSGAGGTGEVRLFTAETDGGFTAGTVTLSVDGPLESVAIAKMFGTLNDVVVTFNTAESAGMAVFHNDTDEFFTEAADVISYTGAAYGLLPIKSNNDNYLDMVITDGIPGVDNHTMYIVHRDGTKPTVFDLEEDIITYLVGVGPGRIHVTDLDGDGKRDDFVIPNSFDGDGGNSVNLVYGQGNSNYTNADRYWTDHAPGLLTVQEWYSGHTTGPNSFRLVIDPRVFYNLTLTEIDSFIIDIMTGTTPIDFARNIINGQEQEGEIIESMSTPIGVDIHVDYLEDEPNANRTLEEPANAAADIEFWRIEVI